MHRSPGPLVLATAMAACQQQPATPTPASPAAASASTDDGTTLLDEGWQLVTDPGAELTAETAPAATGWRPTRAGLSWNAQHEDLRDYAGVAWYRTSFAVATTPERPRVLLRFGAVDYLAEVFVGGRPVGSHEGGYTPFTIDITDAVQPGQNELLVRVIDPPIGAPGDPPPFPEHPGREVPHGKQDWYVPMGGIWQPVTLAVRPRSFVDAVQVTPRVDGSVEIALAIEGDAPAGGAEVRAEIRGPDGAVVATERAAARAGRQVLRARVSGPRLWSPADPALYTAQVTLDGDVPQRARFGFRSFEARGGQLYLNGEPYYMRAALDQNFYPDTIHTAPSREYLLDEMRKAKALGLNMMRAHIKVPEPAYLDAADEVGLLVWVEVPSWSERHPGPATYERAARTFDEMLARDWNHPSIVIHTVINESWGADLEDPEQRAWLLEEFRRTKRMVAPLGRLVVDNSPCCDNYHLETDIDDFHRYNSIPDQRLDWDRWVAEFAGRAAWSFSPHGDARRTGEEPLILSEFGNWGLPRLPAELPWWFGRGFGTRAMTHPDGAPERFREFGLDRLFGSWDAFADATQWHQYAALKYEIEEIRRHGPIQGYVITEFTDLNWEANGLLDMWRRHKIYKDALAAIQQDDIVMLDRLERRNLEVGETIELTPMVSHYGARSLEGAEIRWSFGATRGEVRLAEAPARASVARGPAFTVTAPAVDRPQVATLRLELVAAGQVVASNGYELFVYPARTAPTGGPIAVRGLPALSRALAAAGHRVQPRPARGGLLVAASLDREVRAHLARGGRAVILADRADALPPDASLRLTAREGDLKGHWINNWNWIQRGAPPFDQLALAPLLGFEAETVAPRFIIEGVPPAEFDDVACGITYGWLKETAALAVSLRAGDGRAFVTTLRFDRYGQDPYATRLLDAILAHTASPDLAPKAELALGAAGKARRPPDRPTPTTAIVPPRRPRPAKPSRPR